MTGRVRNWIALLAAAGLLASAGSTYVHAQLLLDPGYASFCDFNARMGCADVYRSRFGSVGGVPVALAGMVWFAGVLLLAAADARSSGESRANVAGLLVVWSTVGLAVAIYLAYASIFLLKTFCVLCGVVYGAAIGIFALSDSGSATPLRRLPRALAHDLARIARRPAAVALVAAIVGAAVAAGGWFRERDPRAVDLNGALSARADRAAEFDRWWAVQPRVASPVSAPDGTVVVVMFTDYQCPACARTHESYEPIFERYAASHPGAVRLVTMDYPLDPACNDRTPNGPHGAACAAAAAVRMAGRVGTAEAEAMRRWLYANQEGLTPERVASAVREIASVEDFEAQYDAAVAEVAADVEAGAALPVEATPTFVVNGVLVKGGLAPEFFDRAIANELAR